MSDVFWRHSKDTVRLLVEIENKRREINEQLGSGNLLAHPTNELLVRGYAKKVGFVECLDYIERLISEQNDDGDEA